MVRDSAARWVYSTERAFQPYNIVTMLVLLCNLELVMLQSGLCQLYNSYRARNALLSNRLCSLARDKEDRVVPSQPLPRADMIRLFVRFSSFLASQ